MMIKNKRIKVAIAMSGGVDSAVAAAILKQEGYNVAGFFVKFWRSPELVEGHEERGDNKCCDVRAMQDAKKIAEILKIPFYVVSCRDYFKKIVVDDFVEEYKNLRTPNPCVRCNQFVKFGWLLDLVQGLGHDYLATGHYARIKKDRQGIFHLLKGKDKKKDQSYFLYRLGQKQLSKIIFPLGVFNKSKTRELAEKFHLPIYSKKDSQEICFIGKSYRDFLKKYLPKKYFQKGKIVDAQKKIIGEHQGLVCYTVGQRKGIKQFSVSSQKNKKPLYVSGFTQSKNQLIVSHKQELFQDFVMLRNSHFISPKTGKGLLPSNGLRVKLRSQGAPISCHVRPGKAGRVEVILSKPVWAVSSGQSAVLYHRDEILGGGIIE